VEAIQQAAENLVNHFFLFSNLNRVAEEGTDRQPLVVSPEIYQMPIEKLELSPRTLNCLKRSHISKVGEVLEMSNDELLKIRNFGEKSLDELKEKLVEHGVTEPLGGGGAVGDISSEELGELMGGGEMTSGLPAEAPGMTIEDPDEDDSDDAEDDADVGLGEDEE